MASARERSDLRGRLGLLGAGLVMVLCCAGPLLVAGGAFGAVGGALRNPWLITVGAVVGCSPSPTSCAAVRGAAPTSTAEVPHEPGPSE